MSIFDYEDYRLFVRDFISTLPRKGYGAINKVAEHLRVHPSLLSQILSSRKDFSLEQAHSLCSFMGLKTLEADFFMLLVQREKAGTSDLKNYFSKKLEEAKRESLQVSKRIEKHRVLTESEKATFYSSYIYSAVRLFASCGDGKSIDEIAERFHLTRAAAAEIVGFLVGTGLCKENGNKIEMGEQRTHLDSKSPFISRLHSNWRLQAIRRSEDLTPEELMFTSPISIAKKDFLRVREQLVGILKKASEVIAASPSEEVACLNIDLFWMR